MTKNTLIIAYEGAQLLDIAGPFQVFASANDEIENPYYAVSVASIDGTHTSTSAGLGLVTKPLNAIEPGSVDTVIVVGGNANAVRRASSDGVLRRWLRACAPNVRRLCSVCTGTFALAAAGLLNTRRVATHWRGTKLLSRLYPDLQVDPDAIYVKDDHIWTSAGVTTGIDMCLALVAEDLGPSVSMAIARRLVLYAHRPGSQSQFSALLEGQAKVDGPLGSTMQWMAGNMRRSITVGDCAAQARMSERTFHRRFVAATGLTPARYLETLRLDTARALLEREKAPLKQIASLSGFSSDQHLILVFEKRLGFSPSDYRKLHGGLRA